MENDPVHWSEKGDVQHINDPGTTQRRGSMTDVRLAEAKSQDGGASLEAHSKLIEKKVLRKVRSLTTA